MKALKIKYLFIMVMLLSLSSCLTDDKKETPAPTPRPSVDPVRLSGVSNFGRIRVDSSMQTEVRVSNSTSSFMSVGVIGLTTDPQENFYISSNTCGSILGSGGNCSIAITFNPKELGLHAVTFSVSGREFNLVGEAIPLGDFFFVPSSWDIGTIGAGVSTTRTFTLFNQGANNIVRPVIDDVRFFVISTDCDLSIPPNSQCDFQIRFTDTESGPKDFDLEMLSLGIGDFPIAVTANVIPGSPSGIIKFQNVPQYISVDDVNPTTIDVSIVPDSFDNPVADGTPVTATITNGVFEGGSSFLTVNGAGSISFRSNSQSGDVTVELSAGEAIGVVRVQARPGPASGTISFENFNNFLRADGAGTVVIQTAEIKDANGNNIADGDDVYFWLSDGNANSGEILTPSPAQSFRGRVFIQYRAGTGAQTLNLNVGANPVFDGLGNITSYNANGTTPITLYPNIAEGDFDITCNKTDVFFLPEAPEDYVDCEIGPITDINSNLVGAGNPIQVSLINALSPTPGSNQSNFTINTEADSIGRFTLRGVGVRGDIVIDAENGGTKVISTLFSYGRQQKKYTTGGDIDVFFKKDSSRFFPLSSTSLFPSAYWPRYTGDLSRLIFRNFSGFGFYSESSDPKVLIDDIPYLTWDCFQEIELGMMIHPCGVLFNDSIATFTATSKPYFMSADSDSLSFALENYGGDLGTIPNHGGNNILYPMTFFERESGKVVISGGLTMPQNPPFATSVINVTSSYGFPRSVRSKFSQMEYFKDDTFITSGFNFSTVTTDEGVFTFGGMSNAGRALIGDLRKIIYNPDADVGNGEKIFDSEILSIDDSIDGSPSPRFDNGITYNPLNNSIYIHGGWSRDVNSGLWFYNTDIWKVDLDVLAWVRICDLCDIPVPSFQMGFVMENIGEIFDNQAQFNNLFGLKSAPRTYYYRDKNKFLVKYENDARLFEANFELGQVIVSTDPDLQFLEGEDYFGVNSITGKIYSYKRGDLNNFNSTATYYDSGRGNKQYYRLQISLEDLAKDYFRSAEVKIYGMGEARTYSPNPQDPDAFNFGLSAYIFNHDTNRYVLLGTNSVSNELNTINNPIVGNINNSGYISMDNKIDILVAPSSNTGFQFGEDELSPSEGKSRVFLNYIEFEGTY